MPKNTIIGRSFFGIIDQIVSTAVAITPGTLLERTSGLLVQAHSTAQGAVENLFALEDDLQGKGIADNYAVSVPIHVWKALPGERVYARASNAGITKGDFVESAGDGTIRTYTKATLNTEIELTNSVIGVALETVVANARVLIEIC